LSEISLVNYKFTRCSTQT